LNISVWILVMAWNAEKPVAASYIQKSDEPEGRTRESIDLTASWAETETSSSGKWRGIAGESNFRGEKGV
jgi:hypothetical protein